MSNEIIDMSQWYTSPQALERLNANSKKKIDARYLRYLAREEKVTQYVISERVRLYKRSDIDNYIVEERGTKAARAKRQQATNKRIASTRGQLPSKKKSISAA